MDIFDPNTKDSEDQQQRPSNFIVEVCTPGVHHWEEVMLKHLGNIFDTNNFEVCFEANCLVDVIGPSGMVNKATRFDVCFISKEEMDRFKTLLNGKPRLHFFTHNVPKFLMTMDDFNQLIKDEASCFSIESNVRDFINIRNVKSCLQVAGLVGTDFCLYDIKQTDADSKHPFNAYITWLKPSAGTDLYNFKTHDLRLPSSNRSLIEMYQFFAWDLDGTFTFYSRANAHLFAATELSRNSSRSIIFRNITSSASDTKCTIYFLPPKYHSRCPRCFTVCGAVRIQFCKLNCFKCGSPGCFKPGDGECKYNARVLARDGGMGARSSLRIGGSNRRERFLKAKNDLE